MPADPAPRPQRSCVAIIQTLPDGATWEEFLARITEESTIADGGVSKASGCGEGPPAPPSSSDDQIMALRRRLGLD